MDDATARRLNRINLAFYADANRAAAFSATREGAWPGWHRLHEVLDENALPPDARVLDIGCGNARLGRFLAEKRPGIRYLGLDASPALLEVAGRVVAGDGREARGGLGASPELVSVDLVEGDLAAAIQGRRFDLAACVGVLHHLPGRARREALLRAALEALAPAGLLAVTCWRLAQFARFRDKTLPWEDWNAGAGAGEPVDLSQLEPGDHLLPFSSGGSSGGAEGGIEGVRYVHFAHEDETAELLAELPCQVIAEFTADGKERHLNRYFVVRRG